MSQGGSPTTRLTLRQADNISKGQQTLLVKSSKGRSGNRGIITIIIIIIIIIRDTEKGTCILIDIAIQGERNVIKKET
jgi:hypothetical protein